MPAGRKKKKQWYSVWVSDGVPVIVKETLWFRVKIKALRLLDIIKSKVKYG